MRDHIIVCGMGHVGYQVVRLLVRLDEKVTVVTDRCRDDWRAAVESYGVIVHIGDARSGELVRKAGLLEARALIVVTDRDLINIEVALDAREVRKDLDIVVRLFDQSLAQHLERDCGVRRAAAMSTLAAPAFAAAVMGEMVSASFTVDGASFIVGDLPAGVDPDAPANGGLVRIQGEGGDATSSVLARAADWHAAMPDPRVAASRQHPLRRGVRATGRYLRPMTWIRLISQIWTRSALALRAFFIVLNFFILVSVWVFHSRLHLSLVDTVYFLTETITTVGYGDFSLLHASTAMKLYGCLVMVLGSVLVAVSFSILTDFIVRSRVEELTGMQANVEEDHVIVVGLGNVGYRIVEELNRLRIAAVAIEKDANGPFVEAIRGTTPVLIGEGRARELLDKAGIAWASAVIAATDNDAVNLAVALTAKELNPKLRTVVRFFDAEFARKVQRGLNVDGAISTAQIAAPTFVASALTPDVQAAWVKAGKLQMIVREGGASRQEGQQRRLMRKVEGSSHFEAVTAHRDAERGDEYLSLVSRTLRELS